MTALIRASAERIESEGIPVGVNRHRRGWERVNPNGRSSGRALHLARWAHAQDFAVRQHAHAAAGEVGVVSAAPADRPRRRPGRQAQVRDRRDWLPGRGGGHGDDRAPRRPGAYDDPHSVEGALSDLQRKTVLRVFSETVTTRLNSPERSAIVVVMQRLHEQDLSGHILKRELGYEHLCLPMEFEADRRCITAIGFRDPRGGRRALVPGALPGRGGGARQAGDGRARHRRAVPAAPDPARRRAVPTDRFVVVDHPPEPSTIAHSIRYWDKAGTKDGGAFTAGVLLHKLKDGRFCVAPLPARAVDALEREREIRQMAELDGKRIPIAIEQEPGSGGKESAETTIRNLAGWRVTADRPTGDKVVRAEPYAAQVQGGNVLLVKGAWNRDFIDEHVSFPVGRAKDQVDASLGGVQPADAAADRTAGPGADRRADGVRFAPKCITITDTCPSLRGRSIVQNCATNVSSSGRRGRHADHRLRAGLDGAAGRQRARDRGVAAGDRRLRRAAKGTLLARFTEVESGRNPNRPELRRRCTWPRSPARRW